MSDLLNRILKNSTLEHTDTVENSSLFTTHDEIISTTVPMINVALSGSIDGGMGPGVTMLAGPSKHFKSGFALLLMKAFFEKYEDGAVLFYVSEFGTPKSYFNSFGLPLNKIAYSAVEDIEQLKFDIMSQINEFKPKDHVMIVIDSLGNLASKKEVNDAISENAVQDMSRPKQIKSLFRMVTPHLTLKKIPMVVVNHTYKTIEKFSKDVVGGGTGSTYSSDNIWIIGRQQDKDQKDNELNGYHFIINIYKSRYLQEGSKIPITISFDGGINRWSGLFEVALECGIITSSAKGWYSLVDLSTGVVSDEKMRRGDIENDQKFWVKVFKTTDFAKRIENKYKIANRNILEDLNNDVQTQSK